MSGRRKLTLGLFSLLLGIGGVLTLVQYVRTSEQRALAGQELVEVFIVQEKVTTGSPASQINESVKLTKIPANLRSSEAVTSIEALGDSVTTVDILPGEQLLRTRFASAETRTVAGSEIGVPDNLLEVTIQTTAERSVGGQVRPGDLVSVIATVDTSTTTQSVNNETTDIAPLSEDLVSKFLVRKALVTNIQASTPIQFEPDPDTDENQSAPSFDLLVTVAIEASDVERLVYVSEQGSVWLAKETELTPEDSTAGSSAGSIFSQRTNNDPPLVIDEPDASDDG